MNKVYTAYRAHQIMGDSRIDLLLKLYRTALRHVEDAERTLADEPESAQVMTHCLRAVELIQGINFALDPMQGDTPVNIARLCNFAVAQLLSPTREGLRSVRQVLTNLREAYDAVREAAVEYERDHLTHHPPSDVLVDTVC